jgi:tripartite-type tricarboxylate transporter receptor subunit TctC
MTTFLRGRLARRATRRTTLMALTTLTMLNSLPLAAADAPWPTRPITLIIPFAAGGGTDSIARQIGKHLSEGLGQPVIVDNRGGAGGAIGANAVARAAPDGYTLLFATSTFATNAAIEPKLPFDPAKDFAPVAMIGRGPLLVVASQALGVKQLSDLGAAARAKPGGLDFCSAGNGSINHLAGEMFRQKTGMEMTHVPFKGSAPALVDLMAGRVDLFFATVPTIQSQLSSGKLTPLAVTSTSRSRLFPDLPTLAEAGVPGMDVTTWWGVLAPAKTPAALVEALNRAVNQAAAAESVKERLLHEGADLVSLTPAGFGDELRKELALWREVASRPGMQLR